MMKIVWGILLKNYKNLIKYFFKKNLMFMNIFLP